MARILGRPDHRRRRSWFVNTVLVVAFGWISAALLMATTWPTTASAASDSSETFEFKGNVDFVSAKDGKIVINDMTLLLAPGVQVLTARGVANLNLVRKGSRVRCTVERYRGPDQSIGGVVHIITILQP